MNKIDIQPSEIRDKANKIKNKAFELETILENVTTEMNNIPDVFISETADSITNQYNNLKKYFDNFRNKVIEHADFLVNTANSYEETDESIKKQAEEFLN